MAPPGPGYAAAMNQNRGGQEPRTHMPSCCCCMARSLRRSLAKLAVLSVGNGEVFTRSRSSIPQWGGFETKRYRSTTDTLDFSNVPESFYSVGEQVWRGPVCPVCWKQEAISGGCCERWAGAGPRSRRLPPRLQGGRVLSFAKQMAQEDLLK